MKNFLVSLLTFTIGVTLANLALKNIFPKPVKIKIKQEIVVTPKIQPAQVPIKVIEERKPFFDSFDKDTYYGGWFIADEFKGMNEVWTVLLSRDSDNSENEELLWSAMILTKNPDNTSNDDDNFQSVSIKVKDDHLQFTTNKIRGIKYKFDGKFIKKGQSFSNEEKVLKGTLQKIVKGKEIAKFTSEFAYFEPVCFH